MLKLRGGRPNIVDAIENQDIQIVFDVPVGRQGGQIPGLVPYRDWSCESIYVVTASLRGGCGWVLECGDDARELDRVSLHIYWKAVHRPTVHPRVVGA